jgi:hypothetical protein
VTTAKSFSQRRGRSIGCCLGHADNFSAMLNWLSTAFQSLSSVWRKLNPSSDKREAEFAKHYSISKHFVL